MMTQGIVDREKRQRVMLSARMRSDRGQVPVSIRNISKKGMCVCVAAVPEIGSFVEITCAGQVVVGQVRWTSETQFGLRSRDKINVAALLGLPREASISASLESTASSSKFNPAVVQRRSEHSSHLARFFQFVCVGFAAGVSALALASVVYRHLHSAFEKLLDVH